MLAFGSVFLAIICLSQAIHLIQEHTLAPPYIAGGENLVHWDLTGSAQLHGDYIRLTPEEEDTHGAMWNNFPCFSNNWEFQVQFHIHGKGVYLNGDGIAIWFVKETDMLHSGPVFGSKNYFSGLGVFIDTFSNYDELHKHRHPFISAMVNNGSLHYEHAEDGTMTQIGGCHASVRNVDVPTRIAISYINEELALYLDIEGTGQWKLCFKAAGIHLPTGYHFGISASTSGISDNHDILAVTSLNMDEDDMEWEDKSDVIPEAENVQIPQEYHKDFIEELRKNEKKREVREEEDEEKEEEREEINEEKLEVKEERQQVKEERQEVKEEITEKEKGEEKAEATESTSEDNRPPSTSLIRKLVYITGAAAIILVAISTFKKYSERRRIRMEKRLY